MCTIKLPIYFTSEFITVPFPFIVLLLVCLTSWSFSGCILSIWAKSSTFIFAYLRICQCGPILFLRRVEPERPKETCNADITISFIMPLVNSVLPKKNNKGHQFLLYVLLLLLKLFSWNFHCIDISLFSESGQWLDLMMDGFKSCKSHCTSFDMIFKFKFILVSFFLVRWIKTFFRFPISYQPPSWRVHKPKTSSFWKLWVCSSFMQNLPMVYIGF